MGAGAKTKAVPLSGPNAFNRRTRKKKGGFLRVAICGVCLLVSCGGMLFYTILGAASRGSGEGASFVSHSRKWGSNHPVSHTFQDVEYHINSGWPMDDPKYDLNGFRLSDLGNADTMGWAKINTHCKQNAQCMVPERVMHLEKSKFSCKYFTKIFERIRTCQKNNAEKVVDASCDRILLDAGFWRNVYQVAFKDANYVLKVIKAKHQGSSKNLLRHIREARLLQLLEDAPNIVPSTGHCLNPETNEFVLITPFYERGNLEAFVEDGNLEKMTAGQVVQWTLQLCRAIDAMHAVNFVHTDLQLRQVLISDDGSLALNDFNRGKWITTNPVTGNPCKYCGAKSRGRWRAPEEYTRAPLDRALDIYSTGMMIWALWSNSITPMEEKSKKQIYKAVPKDYRPELPRVAPRELQDLISQMWQTNPDERPEAPAVVRAVERIVRNLEATSGGKAFLSTPMKTLWDKERSGGGQGWFTT